MKLQSAVLALSAASMALASNEQGGALRSRELSYPLIGGYEPRTDVSDHNRIDLDQKAIEDSLSLGTAQGFSDAQAVYTQGSHSKSVARITLTSGLSANVKSGTTITGASSTGDSVKAKAFAAYTQGQTSIQVQYETGDCYVGGNPNPVTTRCLASTGTLTIEDSFGSFSVDYTNYNALTDTSNGRTIQGFSTNDSRFRPDQDKEPYFDDFQAFVNYYGTPNYGDEWIQAAFGRTSTNFDNGNADFSQYEDDGLVESIKKGTAYLNVNMYVIRELDDALYDCEIGCDTEECNDDAVHALDEAVAFWTGSEEGTDGSGEGFLMYALADKRSANFKTGGANADELQGTSNANIEIFRNFNGMKDQLIAKNCDGAREFRNKIVDLMFIPLIQGTIRYARNTMVDSTAGEKGDAEGAVFAAAVLPRVHACSPADAKIIHDNMQTGVGITPDYVAVKDAFERNYACMNVQCSQIGGLWDSANNQYYENSQPCVGSGPSGAMSVAAGLAGMVAAAATYLLI